MQGRKRIRPATLPIPNTLFQRILPRDPQMAPVIPTGDIIAEIDGLGKDPDRPVDPVAVAKDRLGDPPPAQAVVEGCECEPETFLVRKCELDVLDYEDPEGC